MNEIKTGAEVVKSLFRKHDVIEEYEGEKCCEKHGKYKAMFRILADGTRNTDDCPVCTEIKEKIEREKEEAEAKAELEHWYKFCNIPPEFWNKTLDDYIPKTNGQKMAKEAVENLIETQHGKIIILGSNGTGKTMLSSMAVKELGGYIYTMYEISTMIRQSYTAKADRSELDIVEDLAQAPFLAVDEVGRVKNSEAVRDWFSYIIDKRHTNGKPTILTGNLHFLKQCKNGGCEKCFERYFDSDIVSRLQQDTTIIYIKAEDNRRDNTAKIGGDL